MMQQYKNLGGNSSITSYEIGDTFIIVCFERRRCYRYSYGRAEQKHVEKMKSLAEYGRGLGSYIKEYVNHLYDKN